MANTYKILQDMSNVIVRLYDVSKTEQKNKFQVHRRFYIECEVEGFLEKYQVLSTQVDRGSQRRTEGGALRP